MDLRKKSMKRKKLRENQEEMKLMLKQDTEDSGSVNARKTTVDENANIYGV